MTLDVSHPQKTKAPLVAFLVSWPPLCVLAFTQGLAIAETPHDSFLFDFVASTRFGLAVPREDGIVLYGALATRMGRRFEGRWLDAKVTEEALEAPDFSALTDLNSIVANVKDCRLLIVDMSILAPAALTVAVPFLPLLFFVAPLDQILMFAERILL